MDPSFMVENIETFRSERELKKKKRGFLLEWFCPGLSNEGLICGFERVN